MTITLILDLDIAKIYLNTKMMFLALVVQKLQSYLPAGGQNSLKVYFSHDSTKYSPPQTMQNLLVFLLTSFLNRSFLNSLIKETDKYFSRQGHANFFRFCEQIWISLFTIKED